MVDKTEYQPPDDQDRARQLSLQSSGPPTQIPGYRLDRFLGSGAYGEVWVGVDENTGRTVAIKFYTHRGGVDWSLLSREVEKLVFLSSDRYVVQLLDVGWDSEPPYYVMEYLERGSLDDLLRQEGALSASEALELFHDVATGLAHAHDKGVLHCDLKPANVLLDQDGRPRLADFGQSRLSHEQSPSLGTLFYMAPEQADMESVPDVRWDVYALGAMFYCSITGRPPHRNPDTSAKIEQAGALDRRLAVYRRAIRKAPVPKDHRRLPGMDRALSIILERCLEPEPAHRFGSVHEVLLALDERERSRAQRPLLVLGFLGPLLWLLVMAVIGTVLYRQASRSKERELLRGAHETNYFAAKTVAAKASEEIQRYFRAVESKAQQPPFVDMMRPFATARLRAITDPLSDPNQAGDQAAIAQLLATPEQQALQQTVDAMLRNEGQVQAASWFVCDPQGTQIAAAFSDPYASSTIGQNYSWRTYFHAGENDLREETVMADGSRAIRYAQPAAEQRITQSRLSTPFQSQATKRWKVAVATPVHDGEAMLGVLAVTVDVESFVHFAEGNADFFAVLIDDRPGENQGMVLQHPVFEKYAGLRLPDRFTGYRANQQLQRLLQAESAEAGSQAELIYSDPFASDAEAGEYARPWVAAAAPVDQTGLYVVVQQNRDRLTEPVRELGSQFLQLGLLGLVSLIVVVAALWLTVSRALRPSRIGGRIRVAASGKATISSGDLSTLPRPPSTRR